MIPTRLFNRDATTHWLLLWDDDSEPTYLTLGDNLLVTSTHDFDLMPPAQFIEVRNFIAQYYEAEGNVLLLRMGKGEEGVVPNG